MCGAYNKIKMHLWYMILLNSNAFAIIQNMEQGKALTVTNESKGDSMWRQFIFYQSLLALKPYEA